MASIISRFRVVSVRVILVSLGRREGEGDLFGKMFLIIDLVAEIFNLEYHL